MAGKSLFTNSSTFGSLGAAALRPLFRRASYGGTEIDIDIEASLFLLIYLLHHAPPKSIPLSLKIGEFPILYADAYFTSKGIWSRISELSMATDFMDPSAEAGWGVVVVNGPRMWHFSGTVPAEVFNVLQKKKTYIFLLEVIAQCMGTWLLAPELGSDCWAFVDNVGAEFALRKGFSRDRDANAVVSLFWAAAALTGVRPWFERVPSKAQLADEVSRGDEVSS